MPCRIVLQNCAIELGEPDAALFQIPADYKRQEFNRGFGISRPTKIPGLKEVPPEKPTPEQ